MLELHTWHTPNGRKPAILLAELELEYALRLVDISKGEQKTPDFLGINPNGKIPALVDSHPQRGRITVFESGAILQYLAESHGRFLPAELSAKRAEVMAWTFWQVGGPGPFFGQLGKFSRDATRDELAYGRFLDETKRLVGVLDRRLVDRDFVCDEYSIADIASYPWFDVLAEKFPDVLADAKNVQHWMKRVGARPAVQKGMRLESAFAK